MLPLRLPAPRPSRRLLLAALLVVVGSAACIASAPRSSPLPLWRDEFLRVQQQGWRSTGPRGADFKWSEHQRVVLGALRAEVGRVRALANTCSGTDPLQVSPSAALRDGLRWELTAERIVEGSFSPTGRVEGNRLAGEALRLVSAADWYARRAACGRATTTLTEAERALAQAELVRSDVARAAELDRPVAPASEPGAGPTPPAGAGPAVAVPGESLEALPMYLAAALGGEAGTPIQVVEIVPSASAFEGHSAPFTVASAPTWPSQDPRWSLQLVLLDRAPIDLVRTGRWSEPGSVASAAQASGYRDALLSAVAGSRGLRLVPTQGPAEALTLLGSGQSDGLFGIAPWPGYAAALGLGTLDSPDRAAAWPAVGFAALFARPTASTEDVRLLFDLAEKSRVALTGQPPEAVADLLVARYPSWEPDAVLEAVRAARLAIAR